MIKLKKYTHLTLIEREKLYAWSVSGLKLREIARKLGRNHTTLSRELSKNKRYGKAYVPCIAQKRYERVTRQQRYKAPLKQPEIFLYVRKHIRPPYLWSPEMVSRKLKKDSKGKLTISVECVYQYVRSPKARKYKLWEYLACGRKKRMRKEGRKVRNHGKVPNAVSIEKRPKYIERRKQPGHWETDNMEGSRSSKTALSVTVERATRYTILTKMVNQTKAEKTKAIVYRLAKMPVFARRTITLDNGKENYGHIDMATQLNVKTYFCHAYSSCEKGSVERKIKDIRRFMPKGIPLARVSRKKVEYVEWWLNNRPMKCLDDLTPCEKMQQLVSKLNTT